MLAAENAVCLAVAACYDAGKLARNAGCGALWEDVDIDALVVGEREVVGVFHEEAVGESHLVDGRMAWRFGHFVLWRKFLAQDFQHTWHVLFQNVDVHVVVPGDKTTMAHGSE